jgi:hypothetical protein
VSNIADNEAIIIGDSLGITANSKNITKKNTANDGKYNSILWY